MIKNLIDNSAKKEAIPKQVSPHKFNEYVDISCLRDRLVLKLFFKHEEMSESGRLLEDCQRRRSQIHQIWHLLHQISFHIQAS